MGACWRMRVNYSRHCHRHSVTRAINSVNSLLRALLRALHFIWSARQHKNLSRLNTSPSRNPLTAWVTREKSLWARNQLTRTENVTIMLICLIAPSKPILQKLVSRFSQGGRLLTSGLTPTRVGVFMRKAMNLSLDGKTKTGTGHKMQLNRAHVGKSFDQP